jgi:hypothetical protein
METAGKGEMYVDCRISAPLFQGRFHDGWVTGKLRLPFIEGEAALLAAPRGVICVPHAHSFAWPATV